MKIKYFRVIGQPITLTAGSLVALGEIQARRRAELAKQHDASGTVYQLTGACAFKAGEVIGLPADVKIEKHAEGFVEAVRRSEFEAYGKHLEESRDRSRFARQVRKPPLATVKPEEGKESGGETGSLDLDVAPAPAPGQSGEAPTDNAGGANTLPTTGTPPAAA